MENTGHCDTNYNFNLTGLKNWSAVPTIHEWEQLWSSWDAVTTTMINHDTMLLEQPIGLRHPFIFYLGHIPTFLDVMITRQKVDCVLSDSNGEPHLTEPSKFADIFERGIDPDMDDPTTCNPHSEVPDEGNWPSVDSILQYQKSVRNRLMRLLLLWENGNYMITDESVEWIPSRQNAARVVWMCFEHEAMHLETLLYMLVQSPNFKHPHVPPPSWYKQNHLYRSDINKKATLSILNTANMIAFDGANVEIGHDDFEEMDKSCSTPQHKINFGWDNEHPKRIIAVLPFEIQSRPITNGEYWSFWTESNYDKLLSPASWFIKSNEVTHQMPQVKTSFGLCEFHSAINWPVQVSCQQAEAYAAWTNNGMRLPTEPEWIHFRRSSEAQLSKGGISNTNLASNDLRNYGFMSWTPQPLNNQSVHTIGDVWEWTSTVWDKHEGFTPSRLYPGYSSDFFDGKHRVILGASWATHARIAERISFRNWYQWRYPYVFCGFRLCRSL